MTSEQLQTVRAERWRHTSNPLLTADDAQAWLDAAGLCLFLPRRRHFLAPAPSFVEACTGTPSETPTREAIEGANTILHRLAADNTILPLNLFGALSEQPDFLASREAFPYIFSLRGSRDWKTVPAGETSPLVIQIWKLLEKEGPLTASEIVSVLARELTEAAVLRGLIELWSGLRVLPEYAAGEATRWNLTQARFKDALTTGSKLSQTTALSALVSLYLESVIAASSEEIETFLSPLTSRSRVRETVNGLTATRQLSVVPMGAQSMFYIEGTLPEFAEPEPTVELAGAADSESRRAPRQTDRAPRSFDRERKPSERGTPDRRPARKPDGERKPWPRKAEGERGERAPFGKRPSFGKKPFDRSAKPYNKTGRPFERTAKPLEGDRPGSGERASGGERTSFRPAARSGGAGRSSFGGKFPPKKFGSKSEGGKFAGRSERPWTPRPGGDGERKASGPGDHARPFRPRREEGGDRPSSFRPREGGADRRSGGFAGKSSFSRPKFAGAKKFDGPKKFGGPKSEGSKFGGPKSGGPRSGDSRSGGPRSGAPRPGGSGFGARGKAPEGGKRPFFRKRSEEGSTGEARPRSFSRPAFGGAKPGEGSGRPSGGGASRGGAWKGKPGGGSRSSKPAGSFSKSAREGSERPRSSRPAFGKSGNAGFSKSGKPGFGKGTFGKGKPGGGSFGGKKFGARKPGGTKPPFRKRKDEGTKSAE